MSKEKTFTARVYEKDMAPIKAIHERMLKAWEKKPTEPKPWFADAMRKFLQAVK